jgi:hypothetical protein
MEILDNAAKIGREIFKDIANKHHNGEFMSEITIMSPHLYKEVQKLLNSYCDLLIELSSVFILHEQCQISASEKLNFLIEKLKENRSKERSLFWKAFNIEIGGDH